MTPTPTPDPRAATGSTRHVVVMGVSGSGKSAVARGIRDALGLAFAEADLFHSPAHIARMAAGEPLTGADRRPWLVDLAAWMRLQSVEGRSTVMACSALARSSRDLLRYGPPEVWFIHLAGPTVLIDARMAARKGHLMPASLLASQVATLEPLEADEVGVVLDLRDGSAALVGQSIRWMGGHGAQPSAAPGDRAEWAFGTHH